MDLIRLPIFWCPYVQCYPYLSLLSSAICDSCRWNWFCWIQAIFNFIKLCYILFSAREIFDTFLVDFAEFARQRRQRRNTRQKWVWACIGFSITVGVSLFGCSYIPNFGKDQLHDSSSDASSGIMETQKI